MESQMFSFDMSNSVDCIVRDMVAAGFDEAAAKQSANHWHSWWLTNHK